MSQNPVSRCRQIIHQYGAVDFGGVLSFGFFTVTSADENAFSYARVPATFEVNQLVTDYERLSKLQAELVASIEQELRRGLATATRLIRSFRRDVYFLNHNTVSLKLVGDVCMNFFHIFHREVAASDAGLIRHYHELKSSVRETFQSIENTCCENNVFNAVQVVAVFDENSVAIKKNGVFHTLLAK